MHAHQLGHLIDFMSACTIRAFQTQRRTYTIGFQKTKEIFLSNFVFIENTLSIFLSNKGEEERTALDFLFLTAAVYVRAFCQARNDDIPRAIRMAVTQLASVLQQYRSQVAANVKLEKLLAFGVYEFVGYESGVRVARFSDEWWTVLLTRNLAEISGIGHWISSSSS